MIDKKYITFSREPFFELARPFINKNSLVLDIGSGSEANFSKYFERNDFFLFDGNEETVNKLKQNFENVQQGSLPNLPYNDNKFDVIHCSHVVEHLTPEILYNTLKEMDRCLKNNGYLIISAPLLWDGFYDDLSHIKPYPPAIFKNYLCSKESNSRTRKLISNNYTVEKEIYRYFEVEHPLRKAINTKGNLFVTLWFKFNGLLHKLGLRYLAKTGFTIVLKKQ
jgi:SAM-dependent methyltransferase